ncbi:MAG: flavin reductase family protein [Cardiobacteriaceae bacterium]|nr:flavin reductase family protein [Cardiobacteriaceae bacterium]
MLSHAEFKASLALFASGVTVITWNDDKHKVQGITVSAFSSLSLDPPLVLFCIGKNAYVHDMMRQQSHLAVNILAAGQTDLAWRFAGADRDNLDAHIHRDNPHALPYLNDALCNLSVAVRDILPGGDHSIFIAEVLDSARSPERKPLLYHNSTLFSA